MIKDYFIFSIKNLRNRRLRSWLTMLGIVIGITAVVSLIGMGQGLKMAILSQFGSLGTDKLTVQASGGMGPPGTAVVKPLTKDNLEKISKVNGVHLAAGRLIRSGKLEHDSKAAFGYAASMADGEARKLMESAMNLKAESGRLLKDGDTKKVMLGSNLGKENAGLGKQIVVGSKVLVQGSEFEVIGIMKKQGSFIFDNIVLMNEEDMRKTLDIPNDQYDIIVAQIQSNADIASVQESIEKLMRKERDVKKGEEDFTVQTPQAILSQVNSTLFAVQLFVYIIAGISIVVGGIGIMNTMFTSVLERTKEIGIMKSIGARNSTILFMFFFESGVLGLIGGALGVILGYLIATTGGAIAAASGYAMLKPYFPWWLTVGCLLFSFLIGACSGYFPARQAASLKPVDALRYE